MDTKIAVIAFCASEDEAKAAQKALASLKPAKPTEKPDKKPSKAADDFDEFDEDEAPDLPMPSSQELKKVLLDVRDELGNDSLRAIFKTHGATNIKSLDKEEWPAVYAEAKKLLSEDEEDDDWGDDFDDDETPDAEEVKTAVQNYAKENGKVKATEVLQENGLNTVRGLKKATDDQLKAIMKAVS